MNFKPTSTFEIVRLIDLQPNGQSGFLVLIVPGATPELVREIAEELELQTGGSLGVIDVTDLTAASLISRLRAINYSAVLLRGFDSWSDDRFAALDVNRSGLETGGFLVFAADQRTAGRFLDRAPNLRSYFGTNIFAAIPDPTVMTPEEIEERLDQLRAEYGMSDDGVLAKAARGDLPPDPHFAEWLVLLGRSELVR